MRVQLRAYEQACGRFRKAAAGDDAVVAYAPLAEALWHAVSLDDRIARYWQPGGVELPNVLWFEKVPATAAAPAVRWARNAVSHQWFDALVLDRRSHGRYPSRDQEWVWRRTEDVPGKMGARRRKNRTQGKPDLDALGAAAYKSLLSGRPADFTLQILAEGFAFVVELAEPLSPGTFGSPPSASAAME